MKRINNRLLIGVAAAGLLLAAGSARANNLVVTNVTVIGRDNSTAYVKFDISWENSWRYTNINHDAAWVFFKVQREGETAWQHVTLEGSGINPPDYSTGAGTAIELIVPTDRVGLFVRRAAEGTGTVAVQNVKAVWNFTSNSLPKTAKVKMSAFGVEMVYVAQAAFKVGSGGTDFNGFYAGDTVSDPYAITNEDAITVGTAAGNLYYRSDGFDWGDKAGPIPADFPKGYNAFYCMKYEITQGQYRDFLNTLTRQQQNARTSSQTTNYFAMGNSASIQYRNGIRCPSNVPTAPETIVFGCDANGNGTFNETNDAMDRACNYLVWADGCALAAWAGLRPMTELEFEKACRGPLTPEATEYAWGTTTISLTSAGGILRDGDGTDTATSGNCNYSGSALGGPYRVGIYATGSSSRQAAGASYWGIMELSGNLMERAVTVGKPTGRLFTGLHGNGVLTAGGAADFSALKWPESDGAGPGHRGGSWNDGSDYARVSDRHFANGVWSPTPYSRTLGARSVRTAPSGVGP